MASSLDSDLNLVRESPSAFGEHSYDKISDYLIEATGIAGGLEGVIRSKPDTFRQVMENLKLTALAKHNDEDEAGHHLYNLSKID